MSKPWVLAVFLSVFFSATHSRAAPSDERAWLKCTRDRECTAVELGCYYWQPVNGKYASLMLSKYAPACTKSFPPGPQPRTGCSHGLCVNDPFTVRDWNRLEPVQKNQFVSQRLIDCLKQARIRLDWLHQGATFIELRDPFMERVDRSIRKGKLRGNQLLATAIKSLISCPEVIADARKLSLTRR